MVDSLSVKIPFCGFYESFYSQEIDSIEERECEYMVEKESEIKKELRLDENDFREIFSNCTTYAIAYEKTAEKYVSCFSDWFSEMVGFNVPMEFEEMTSPRYYNFETDRLFALIPYRKLARLFIISKKENHERLKDTIKRRFTSRDGFLSHYDNRLDSWLEKPLRDWDHNELGTLLESFMNDSESWDFEVYESVVDCDGLYHEWSESVDWKAFDELVTEKRQEKLDEILEIDPEFTIPEPRCPYTLEMF